MNDNSQVLRFSTNVQLKSIIGKDLINDDRIAILELVKNSFDANASRVEIRFLNLKQNDDKITSNYTKNTSRIVIQDDGKGMTLNDISTKWLNIAYSEKKKDNIQNKRFMAGAKGIGRFSCDRLGRFLNIYSKTKNDDKYILLQINWSDFEIEDPKREIQSIPLSYQYLSKVEIEERGIYFHKDHGVTLEIISLRSEWIAQSNRYSNKWNTDKLLNLKRYLEKLINPTHAFEEVSSFNIYMDAPELLEENNDLSSSEKFLGKVENRVFEKLDFKSTSIECETLERGELIQTVLKDKGSTIFKIEEKNPYSPFVTDAKVTIYYLNPYAKAFFTKQTGIRSIDYGSIFLFINGFRISPYGDPGNDWLNLNFRKTQGTSRFFGVREIIGNVEIRDSDGQFQVVTSREGLVENKNFHALTDSGRNNSFIFKALRRLEKYVVDGLGWDSIPDEGSETYQALEKKILAGTIKDDELVFSESTNVKLERVYNSIHSIISAKPKDVIKLYINEDLILKKINEEKKQSILEFEELIEQLNSKKIDENMLSQILHTKAKQNKELSKQILQFENYGESESISIAVLELQKLKSIISSQISTIQSWREKYKQLEVEFELKQKEYSAKQLELELEKKDLEKKLQQKETQLSFFKASQPLDKDRLEKFHHDIGILSNTIKLWVDRLTKTLINLGIDKQRMTLPIDGITRANNKILAISRIATKAGFDKLNTEIEADLIQYIKEYSQNVYPDLYGLKINTEGLEGHSLKAKFKPLDLSILLDNIINNSTKANANKILLDIVEDSITKIVLSIKDNGQGFNDSIVEIKDVFEKGFTTTSGSGLGLSTCKEIVNHLNGDISVERNKHNSEFNLLITFYK